jgi:hypothetical protein
VTFTLKPNRVYVLRSGDTLDFLAGSCGTTVETMRMHNPVLTETPSSEALPVGMVEKARPASTVSIRTPAKTSVDRRLPNYRAAALLVAGNPAETKSCLMM